MPNTKQRKGRKRRKHGEKKLNVAWVGGIDMQDPKKEAAWSHVRRSHIGPTLVGHRHRPDKQRQKSQRPKLDQTYIKLNML